MAEGTDGVALTDGTGVVPLSTARGDQLRAGPIAVPLDADTAAVVSPDRLHLVGPQGELNAVTCKGCMGIAAAAGELVTAHNNDANNDTFDIVVLDHQLSEVSAVAAPRLKEETVVADRSPLHDPAVLAASTETVTVSYLSVNSNEDGGPSVLAQYSRSGELLASVMIDGTVRRSAVSPNGRFLAIGPSLYGGACPVNSDPLLFELDGLRPRELGPGVPTGLAGGALAFEATDVAWDGSVASVTGLVMRDLWAHGGGGGCDEHPGLWTLRYDTESGTSDYLPAGSRMAGRSLGEECSTLVGVHFDSAANQLEVESQGAPESLGEFGRLELGVPLPSDCPSPQARPNSWPGNAATDVYFASSLYDGNLQLPGMTADPVASSGRPSIRPGTIKLGSGVTWRLNSWNGWGTAEANAAGTYKDHADFESTGTVVLSNPAMCGSSLMYTRIEQRWDVPVPANIAEYTPTVINLKGCS